MTDLAAEKITSIFTDYFAPAIQKAIGATEIKVSENAKTYRAVYQTYSNGDDDCGMEAHTFKADNDEQAGEIAKKYQGSLYKIEIIS